MNVNFNLVGTVLAAAPGKTASASYEQVIAAVEKNLNLEEFSSELTISFSKGGKEPKVWTAHLHSTRDFGGQKIAKFYGQREDGVVLKRKGEQFSQRNRGAAQPVALGEEASKAGVFGTDDSFKDVLELTKLATEYDKGTFEKVKTKIVSNEEKDYFHLVLVAKPGKSPFYHKREMWVDPQTMVPVKMDVFGSTGQRLKTLTVKKTQSFQGINYPVEINVKSMARDTETNISLSNLRALERSKVLQDRD